MNRVILQFNDGTEHVITGEIHYGSEHFKNDPRTTVTIEVRRAKVILEQSLPERLDLAPCRVCGAQQGPLHLPSRARHD